MAKTATLKIDIISDASGATRGLDDATSGVDRFQRGLDRASIAAGAALGGLALLGKSAFDAASAMQQSTGAIESVFGASATIIKSISEDAAQGVGLSTSAYQDMAAAIGASLKNMGQDQDTAAGNTAKLIQYGADLAATYGGTTADAVAALGSALRGETDPIERYGINIKQATIDAYLAAQGLDGLTGAAATQAQAAAVMALVQQQAGGALGAFAREADTAAGQQQRATAEMENAAATIGQALLPIVADLATKLAEVARWAAENSNVIVPLAVVIGGLAAAVLLTNAAVAAWTAITTIATAAQWLWNVALSANPLGLIILAIAAVVGAVIFMYSKFEWFRDLVGAIGDFFGSAWEAILTAIQWVWDKVSGLGDVFSSVFGWISDVMSPVVDVISWIADKIQWVIDAAGDVGEFIGGLFSAPAAPPAAGRALYGAGGLRTAGSLLTAGGGAATSPGGAVSGAAVGTVVNVTVNGALDPVAVGRQIEGVLRDYSRRTGRQVAAAL